MYIWLTANLGTIIMGAIVLFVIASIVISMVRNKKKGKTSCGCGCGGCPMDGVCHEQN